jgi:pimeloyl-ACP methyl ester carboxylesterase
MLFLLPGLLCDRSIWAQQVEALAPVAEISIPDLRGIDRIPTMAQRVLDRAPAKFSLAGHSLGGRIALEIVRQAPERVERLALLDTGVIPVQPGEPERRRALVELAERAGMRALAEAWLPPMVHPDRHGDRDLIDPLLAMIERSTVASFTAQVEALLQRPNARPILESIQCPTLVLCGRQDGWSPLSHHEEIAAAIAGAKLVVVEDSGHMSTVEQPEAVSGALRAWLLPE